MFYKGFMINSNVLRVSYEISQDEVTNRCEMFSNSLCLTSYRRTFLLNAVVFLPIIVLLLIYYFLPTPIANIVSAVSGIIGILLHPFILKWFAKKYESNRYNYFERYRN